jgi:cell division protein FtsW (lipid II flippase)
MPTWKVLIIALLGCISLALVMATILIPMDKQGNDRWIWLGGLLAATLLVGAIFARFLKYAGASLDLSPNRSRR